MPEKALKEINSLKSKQMRHNVDIMFSHYRPSYDSSGETSLWQSVIIQAALDIFSESKCPKAKRAKTQAIAWFNKTNEDFVTICSFAELDPDFVVRGMKKALHRLKKNKTLGCSVSLDQDPNPNNNKISILKEIH